jgi:RNA polymerase sigma factor (sigma-70 family)
VSENEASFLRRYAKGRDAEAFQALVELHKDMVFAACHRVLGNRADAEDAAQDCFLQLAQAARRLRAPIAGWLHKVAVRRAISMLRQRNSRRAREEKVMVKVAAGSEVTWDEIRGEVDEAIAALPERIRVPLVLHYLEGRTQVQVAAQLGVSQPAVSQRMGRALEVLRRRLAKGGLFASAAGLSVLLADNAIEAAPATLTAALGSIAISGAAAGGAGGGIASAVAGIGSSKLLAGVIAAAGVALSGVAVHIALGQAGPPPQPPAALAADEAAVAQQDQGGPDLAVEAAPAQGVRLGPAVERVVGNERAGKDCFIDLDTGKLLTPPKDMEGTALMLAWAAKTGADALCQAASSTRSLVGVDMLVIPLEDRRWDELRPEHLQGKEWGALQPGSVAFMTPRGKLPAIYAFQTGEGSRGVLQIAEWAEQPSGARIRYRLLEGGIFDLPQGLVGTWAGLAVDKPGEGTSVDPLALVIAADQDGTLRGEAFGRFAEPEAGGTAAPGPFPILVERDAMQMASVQFNVFHRTGALMPVKLKLTRGRRLIGEGVPAGDDACDIQLWRVREDEAVEGARPMLVPADDLALPDVDVPAQRRPAQPRPRRPPP